ncbi:sodium-dependent glucose transporter 1 isoform X1 [Lingula anatina]|uniref:Sodium-dependent glucose transporter 1 isoform X1 n=2 Tax=Lingula anatina TaxID=7574 RepID=A0A1S3IUR3_LINAN|nr:sodium-dependent glucose transporter 1 isoform X1 [Lingula anatina]|eukprot:XP_013401279.1 sodium-dependent glucose transporter 1 isoform X1 [Lingula anatina]
MLHVCRFNRKSAAFHENTSGSMESKSNTEDHIAPTTDGLSDSLAVSSFNCYRVAKTGCMVLIWVSMGLYCLVLGPTLIDLIHHLHVNYEELSHAALVRCIGIIIGSFAGGFLCDKFNHHVDFILATALFLLAGSTAAIPWAPGLVVLGLCFFGQGLSHGSLSAGGNAMVIAMWDDKAAAPLQAVHMGFGLGALGAPLIAGPFLSHCTNNTNGTLHPHEGYLSPTAGYQRYDSDVHCSRTHIQYTYGIIGGICLLTSVIFYVFYIHSRIVHLDLSPRSRDCREEKRVKDIVNPASCAQGNKVLGIQLLGLLFLFMVGDVCKAGATNNYMFTIAVNEMHFTKPTAIIFNTTFYATIAVGRLIGIVFAKFVRLDILLILGVLLNVGAQTGIYLSLNWSFVYFWVLSCLYATVDSPMIPLCIAWADKYLDVTGCVMSLMDFGISMGDLTGTLAAGHLYEHYGGRAVLLLTTGSAGICVLVTVTMQLIGCINGKKASRQESRSVIAENYEHDESDERTPLIN